MEYRHRIETIPDTINQAVAQDADEMLSLRKDEILLGRNSDGEPFTPSYTDDPYFHSREAAIAYGERKYRLLSLHNMRIEHVLGYPNKDDDTPNLIVRGDFQDGMFIHAGGDTHEIGSTYEDAGAIDSKYDHKVFPLGPEARAYFWKYILFPACYNHLWK